MPTRELPSRPPARHTFGRVWNFDLACPNCGAVDAVRTGGRPAWWKGTKHFNRWRSRWRCRSCRRIYAIGLVVWPVRRAGNRPRFGGSPIDTRPDTDQASQLRRVYARVKSQSRGWHEPVNLICRCDSEDGEHSPHCPLWDGPPE